MNMINTKQNWTIMTSTSHGNSVPYTVASSCNNTSVHNNTKFNEKNYKSCTSLVHIITISSCQVQRSSHTQTATFVVQ